MLWKAYLHKIGKNISNYPLLVPFLFQISLVFIKSSCSLALQFLCSYPKALLNITSPKKHAASDGQYVFFTIRASTLWGRGR